MASPALTPALALRYLGELSTDVRAAVLLDPRGDLAASDPEGPAERLAQAVSELLAAADREEGRPVGEVEVTTPGGAVFVARRGGWALAVVAGRFALSSLMRYDLRRILVDLEEGRG